MIIRTLCVISKPVYVLYTLLPVCCEISVYAYLIPFSQYCSNNILFLKFFFLDSELKFI